MPRIELAGPADLNFVRRAWAQDVTDSSEIRLELSLIHISEPTRPY